ncbi:hypothetical protein DINM_004189 [Dirofilaria immitis]|nr:hypothetical protein [Dirofilaria immitis]
MFRKVKSRSNLRQRMLSDDDDVGDDESAVNSGISVVSTTKGTSISRKVKQQQQQHAEKVNKAEGNQELQAGVVTEEHHLLSFDNFEGDDITDFKIKRKDPNKHLDKLTKKPSCDKKLTMKLRSTELE